MAFTVYVHTNKINGKKYVGVTQKKPEKRWRNGNGYERQYFYNAILKYGWENFEHTILKTGLTQEEANYYEKYYIKEFDSLLGHNGYNAAIGGYDAGMTGLHHSEESKKKMSENRPSKPVIQFSKTSEFIAEYPSTREAERQTGCNQGHICECCKGRLKTCGGYIWKYKKI